MPEELETILRLVAEGHLTPDEASPIIAAITRAERAAADDDVDARLDAKLRIKITEGGRQVVNLRIPIGFVESALKFVPGLGGDQGQRIRDAVRTGAVGPILDVEDPDGKGRVLISVE